MTTITTEAEMAEIMDADCVTMARVTIDDFRTNLRGNNNEEFARRLVAIMKTGIPNKVSTIAELLGEFSAATIERAHWQDRFPEPTKP
jgi:hypothetical protein